MKFIGRMHKQEYIYLKREKFGELTKDNNW